MALRWARKIERACCACATYFPLFFVYGLTSWAVYVVVSLGSYDTKVWWLGEFG
jgi:palmitoyltransferase ZDHHC2/15/20